MFVKWVLRGRERKNGGRKCRQYSSDFSARIEQLVCSSKLPPGQGLPHVLWLWYAARRAAPLCALEARFEDM